MRWQFIKYNDMMMSTLKNVYRPINLAKRVGFFFSNDNIINKQQQNKKVSQIQKSLNSIMPTSEEGFAYGHYFPKDWTQQKIRKVLDPSLKQIERVSIMNTKVGQHSGKVLIKFKDGQVRKKYIEKYNEDFLIVDSQSQKVVILPFELKTIQQKKKAREGKNFKYPVRLSNVDFDITENEIRKLANDYGEISHIDMNLRQTGINKGFATVYFQKLKSANEFVSFIDGLLYRDRKFKAHLEIKKPQKIEKKFLKVPTLTFKANEELMKKLKSKQYQLT